MQNVVSNFSVTIGEGSERAYGKARNVSLPSINAHPAGFSLGELVLEVVCLSEPLVWSPLGMTFTFYGLSGATRQKVEVTGLSRRFNPLERYAEFDAVKFVRGGGTDLQDMTTTGSQLYADTRTGELYLEGRNQFDEVWRAHGLG